MSDIIKPQRLTYGDIIGICAPSYANERERIENSKQTLENLGFKVKFSEYAFSKSWEFAGSIEERSEDFNNLISESEVKMILFGGGEVCNEILPYIDYENIRKNPKIICSYSDGTTLLTAIYYKSNLVTFYGQIPGTFENISDYNRTWFENIFVRNNFKYIKNSEWKSLNNGVCSGKLIGGYLVNFAVIQNGKYFGIDKNEEYILFVEDHIMFSSPAVISKYFSHIEQSGLFENVSGLIFGNYLSKQNDPEYAPSYLLVLDILKRLGKKYNIPVAVNDDFGHGENNAVYPIGLSARLEVGDTCADFEFTEMGAQ